MRAGPSRMMRCSVLPSRRQISSLGVWAIFTSASRTVASALVATATRLPKSASSSQAESKRSSADMLAVLVRGGWFAGPAQRPHLVAQILELALHTVHATIDIRHFATRRHVEEVWA